MSQRQARGLRLEESSRGGAAAARPAHTRKAAGSNPAPASIYGILRPGDVLRSGRVRIVGGSHRRFGRVLEIWDGDRAVALVSVDLRDVKFLAHSHPDRGIYPEFKRAAAVSSSSRLRPHASRLPLIRVGQGDYTRDLTEEDLG